MRVYLRTAETETPLTSPGAASIRFELRQSDSEPGARCRTLTNISPGLKMFKKATQKFSAFSALGFAGWVQTVITPLRMSLSGFGSFSQELNG